MDNDAMKVLLNSIGAMAEMASLYYRQLLKQGFNQTQALELTKTMTHALFTPRSGGNDNE